MTRKFSINFEHDGKAVVTSEIDVRYITHERGIEVLIGLIKAALPQYTKVPTVIAPTPEVNHDKEIARLFTPSVIPSDELKPVKAKRKGRNHTQHGDLQLTVTFGENKKEYQRQWSLCRKFGFVTYPEALKKEAECQKTHTKQGKRKKAEAVDKRGARLGMRALKSKSVKVNDSIKPLTLSNSVNESVKAIPLINELNESAKPAELPELKLRQRVKHNGLISSPYHHQIGIVERMPPGGDILVKFDNGGTGWIPRGDLEVVP